MKLTLWHSFLYKLSALFQVGCCILSYLTVGSTRSELGLLSRQLGARVCTWVLQAV